MRTSPNLCFKCFLILGKKDTSSKSFREFGKSASMTGYQLKHLVCWLVSRMYLGLYCPLYIYICYQNCIFSSWIHFWNMQISFVWTALSVWSGTKHLVWVALSVQNPTSSGGFLLPVASRYFLWLKLEPELKDAEFRLRAMRAHLLDTAQN